MGLWVLFLRMKNNIYIHAAKRSLPLVGIERMGGNRRKKEIGVFIKTSLGTRLALSVPPATTAALLIREVERAHYNCLPSFGEIKVQGLMVKYQSCFYHLSPSAPLVCTLRDCKGPCFLHATAIQVNTCSITGNSKLGHAIFSRDGIGGVECSMTTALEGELEQKCQLLESEVIDSQSVVQACVAEDRENCLASDPSRDCTMNFENSDSVSIGFPTHSSEKKSPEDSLGAMVGDNYLSENSSATRSVTDIIRRHYSATDTVLESQYLPKKKDGWRGYKTVAASPVGPHITPRLGGFFILQDAGSGRMSAEGKRPDVGQRLLMASSKLGIIPSNPSSKARKHLGTDLQIRNPIFELSESTG